MVATEGERVKLQAVVPILRMFDVAKAKEFYVDYLGFQVDWEHRFEPELPLYMQISKHDVRLHLSEHYGDGSPGANVRIEVNGIKQLQQELIRKQYGYARPGLERMPWGSEECRVTDPFGNRLAFYEPVAVRIDTASRVIHASPSTIYQALVDPQAWLIWLPPKGMKGRIYEFDASVGGTYRMSLTYLEAEHAAQGKTSEHSDMVQGKFLELVPEERVVQQIAFESDDPQFAGEMKMSWRLEAVPAGTEVTIECENVPAGIRPEDHDVGLRSSLENLASFTEAEAK